MEYGCKGRVVVITGGTSGIGLAAARSFWLDGADVSVIGRDSTRGMKALAEIVGCREPDAVVFPGLTETEQMLSAADGRIKDGCGRLEDLLPGDGEALQRLRYIRADVAQPAECRRAAVTAARYGSGRIDILVNSAGIYQETRLENISLADYNRIMDVNVKGTLFMTQACQPYMLLRGQEEEPPAARGERCVVNIASDAGIRGNYGCPLYCASKGAVVALSNALALDLAPDIRVNCICPGDVDTPLLAVQLAAANGGYSRTEIGEHYPLGRIASAQEVAHVICSVASPANSFMTGAVIPVDGGLTAAG